MDTDKINEVRYKEIRAVLSRLVNQLAWYAQRGVPIQLLNNYIREVANDLCEEYELYDIKI